MSTENGDIPEVTVGSDDENTVDKKIKGQILNLRSVVDDDERRLYVDRIQEVPHYTRQDANRDWGVSVRQYIRSIKRLWADHEDVPIKNVKQYWEEMRLHDEPIVLHPPDSKGYAFSMVRHADRVSERELREMIGLPRSAELPEPKVIQFKGLQSVLSRNQIGHTWFIKVDAEGPPPTHESVEVSQASWIPKHILENAVEAADNFLQQAGLGFDIEIPAYTGENGPGL